MCEILNEETLQQSLFTRRHSFIHIVATTCDDIRRRIEITNEQDVPIITNNSANLNTYIQSTTTGIAKLYFFYTMVTFQTSSLPVYQHSSTILHLIVANEYVNGLETMQIGYFRVCLSNSKKTKRQKYVRHTRIERVTFRSSV